MPNNNKNPLFVVTNNGQDVEEASNLMDALMKRFGLIPWIETFNQLLELLAGQVQSYAVFTVVKEFIDQIVEAFERLLKKIDPVLAFSVFKR